MALLNSEANTENVFIFTGFAMCTLDWCNQDAVSYKLLQASNEVISDVKIQLSLQSFHFRDTPLAREKNTKLWEQYL